MKRLVVLLVVAIGLMAASVASAYRTGLGSSWSLTANAPSFDTIFGKMNAETYILGPAAWEDTESCIQVEGSGGTWYTKSNSCFTLGVNNYVTNDATLSYTVCYAPGHVYRAWGWGYANGAQATVVSAPLTAPGTNANCTSTGWTDPGRSWDSTGVLGAKPRPKRGLH